MIQLTRFIHVGEDNPGPYIHIDDDGEEVEILPHSRTFIPASLSDNPYLSGGQYKATLQALPKELQRSLLKGIFTKSFQDDPWQVIPSAWVEASFKRWEEWERDGKLLGPMLVLGADISRGGKDKTTLAPFHGRWFGPLINFEGVDIQDGPAAAAQIITHLKNNAWVHIDALGVGTSPYDCLKNSVNVYPVGGGEATDELDKSGNMAFKNVRALMYWQMREALKPRQS